jgi:hypothetical protein
VSLRVKSSELPHIVHPLTQEVLLLVEIYSRVQDVMDHCSHPDYQVLRTLQTLVERGIVATRRESVPMPGVTSEALFSPGQVRRLREWLDGWGGRSGGTGDAKLLLVSSDDADALSLLRALRALPGASVRPVEPLPAFGVVARLQVDGETGIELVHVPASAAAAPLWRAAGHRALGALVLLAGPVAVAAQRLRDVTTVLRGLPRARLFHVLLRGAGARSLAEELGENVGLLDEGSVFLLPLDATKDPASLLRGVFARVVP